MVDQELRENAKSRKNKQEPRINSGALAIWGSDPSYRTRFRSPWIKSHIWEHGGII